MQNLLSTPYWPQRTAWKNRRQPNAKCLKPPRNCPQSVNLNPKPEVVNNCIMPTLGPSCQASYPEGPQARNPAPQTVFVQTSLPGPLHGNGLVRRRSRSASTLGACDFLCWLGYFESSLKASFSQGSMGCIQGGSGYVGFRV